MKELKFSGGYVKRYWARYAAGIIALAAVDLMNVYIPQFTGEITDGLRAGTIGMDGVWRLVGLIVAMGAGMALGRFGWRFYLWHLPGHRKRYAGRSVRPPGNPLHPLFQRA